MWKRPWILIVLVGGCGERDFAPCDIRQRECQQDLIAALQRLRTPRAVTASFRVASVDDLLAESAATTTEDERASFARNNEIIALFNLSVPGLTLGDREANAIQQTAASYSSTSDQITIVDRGRALDSPSVVITFVHELVHAMQGAEGLLASAFADADTTDRFLARRAIIEGEASMYEDLAALDLYGWRLSDERYADATEDWQDRNFAEALVDPLPLYDAIFHFVYAYGTEVVRAAWEANGPAGVAEIYRDLPATTFAILTGREPLGELREPLAAKAIAIANPPFETVLEDSFGAWIFGVWCVRELGDSAPRPLDIVDDAFTGFAAPDGRRAGVWRVRIPDLGTAETIAQLARAKGYEASLLDGDLVVQASNLGAPSIDGWRARGD